MIIGIGTDIVKIDRIKSAVFRHPNFINRFFDEQEIEYFNSRNLAPESIAGRFAAKEAVSKALGTGFNGFGFKDISIARNTSGKPIVILRGEAKFLAEKYGNYKIHLSISHEFDNAVAFAVMEVDKIENCQCGDNEKY
ncbi:MAG: holo-ACP synthase [Clostridium sp.]|uniref:holo-ACP synthase n=1 Tax=Clostridium sp. TaxID=1506 RepID=UPI0025C6198C|nr:holo-ACP synthase [Clostridium sp.]MCH3965868.1 holo-ACP synthase [Clostridium sp.]MCI1716043.1 holo-ACP synthase [Clostridium sp.]MCI1800285.1 holo-ACP synthase [Clostridium sp.]MCI1814220.1 holo-ACP synthase [Clostridium sp.]MCI1871119.1 holo-ACP synthase [Clostridium sp.]